MSIKGFLFKGIVCKGSISGELAFVIATKDGTFEIRMEADGPHYPLGDSILEFWKNMYIEAEGNFSGAIFIAKTIKFLQKTFKGT